MKNQKLCNCDEETKCAEKIVLHDSSNITLSDEGRLQVQ